MGFEKGLTLFVTKMEQLQKLPSLPCFTLSSAAEQLLKLIEDETQNPQEQFQLAMRAVTQVSIPSAMRPLVSFSKVKLQQISASASFFDAAMKQVVGLCQTRSCDRYQAELMDELKKVCLEKGARFSTVQKVPRRAEKPLDSIRRAKRLMALASASSGVSCAL